MQVEIETIPEGWRIHLKRGAHEMCVAAEDRSRGGSRLSAIEKALIELQSAIVVLDKARNEEREH